MDKEKAQALLNKYLEGSCNAEERLLVERWYNELSKETELLPHEPNWELTRQKIHDNLPPFSTNKTKNLRRYYAAAATLLFALGISSYLYVHQKAGSSIEYGNDVKPGSNKAILTLANGQKINLDNVKSGDLSTELHLKITKVAGGKILYTMLDAGATTPQTDAFNTIETPNGGQYQINLPDGTKVWLNAASSLKYPTVFAAKQRKVELKGEAYFEVAHNKEKPFIVVTTQQNVQVLGTHFNVNAYPDETTINTTLIEGKVKVTGKGIDAVLNPGQQSVLTTQTHQVKVQDANIESAMAWKNGDFIFKEENLESVMRKVSRWYDVDVIYDSNAPRTVTLGGWISRSKNISAVLKIMELTGKVHFKVDGRRITVMQ